MIISWGVALYILFNHLPPQKKQNKTQKQKTTDTWNAWLFSLLG